MFTSFNARAMGLTLPLDETLRLASENGFGGVDLMVRDLVESGTDLDEVRRRLDDLGLRPGAFPFPFDWRGDEASFRAGMDALPRYAEAASRLGLTRTGTWVLPETPERPDEGSPAWTRHGIEVAALHVRRLSEILRALAPLRIRLGLEVIGVESSRTGRGWPFVDSMAKLGPLRAALEAETGIPTGVLVDAWHLYAAGEPIAAAFLAGVERIVWVHVADLPAGAARDRSTMIDSVRGLPGESGAVESRPLLGELKRRGYDGPVTAEPLARCRSLSGRSPEEAARRVGAALRSVWPDDDGV